MTDCAKTLDFFAAWKRMCQEQHGACRGCPLFGDATGSIFTCQRYAFEQPAEAVRADSTLTATVRPSAAAESAGAESIGSSIYKEE